LSVDAVKNEMLSGFRLLVRHRTGFAVV
jgi:hypothetical protein